MPRVHLRLWRIITVRLRLFAGFGVGILTQLFLPTPLTSTAHAILSWDAGVVTYLALAAVLLTGRTPKQMEEDAAAQEEGEWAIFSLTVAAAVFSFVAIFSEFADAKAMAGGTKVTHVVLVVVTLVVSWLMTHATFGFRYAHEYYSRTGSGPELDEGLQFPGRTRPDYLDFTYFALTVGMTFQVSDVVITSRKFRGLVLLHSLLSFMFATTIVALTVNLSSSLL